MGRVLSRVRHLVAALALAGASVVLVQPSAQAACTCEPNTSLREQARAADVVFQGFLSDRQDTRRQRTFTLEVERVYRGTITESPVEVVSNADHPE
jgi:16S rRNA C1402 (ribose-2'-O) methylase RsmI